MNQPPFGVRDAAPTHRATPHQLALFFLSLKLETYNLGNIGSFLITKFTGVTLVNNIYIQLSDIQLYNIYIVYCMLTTQCSVSCHHTVDPLTPFIFSAFFFPLGTSLLLSVSKSLGGLFVCSFVAFVLNPTYE